MKKVPNLKPDWFNHLEDSIYQLTEDEPSQVLNRLSAEDLKSLYRFYKSSHPGETIPGMKEGKRAKTKEELVELLVGLHVTGDDWTNLIQNVSMENPMGQKPGDVYRLLDRRQNPHGNVKSEAKRDAQRASMGLIVAPAPGTRLPLPAPLPVPLEKMSVSQLQAYFSENKILKGNLSKSGMKNRLREWFTVDELPPAPLQAPLPPAPLPQAPLPPAELQPISLARSFTTTLPSAPLPAGMKIALAKRPSRELENLNKNELMSLYRDNGIKLPTGGHTTAVMRKYLQDNYDTTSSLAELEEMLVGAETAERIRPTVLPPKPIEQMDRMELTEYLLEIGDSEALKGLKTKTADDLRGYLDIHYDLTNYSNEAYKRRMDNLQKDTRSAAMYSDGVLIDLEKINSGPLAKFSEFAPRFGVNSKFSKMHMTFGSHTYQDVEIKESAGTRFETPQPQNIEDLIPTHREDTTPLGESIGLIPWDAEFINELVEAAKEHTEEQIGKTQSEKENLGVRISITMDVVVSSYDSKTDDLNRVVLNSHPPEFHLTASEEIRRFSWVDDAHGAPAISQWMEKFEMKTKNLTSSSDSYAIFEGIMLINISFKSYVISGGGNVRFLDGEKFSSVYNPMCSEYCFFECLEHAGLNPTKPVSTIIHELNLKPLTALKDIDRILAYFPGVIIDIYGHEPVLNKFVKKCAKGSGTTRVVLGLIYSHYFYVQHEAIMLQLRGSQFENVSDLDQERISKINPNGEISMVNIDKNNGARLWAVNSLLCPAPFSKDTDPVERKNQEYLISEWMTAHKKGRWMNNIYFWDTETMVVPEMRAGRLVRNNEIYAVGITKGSERLEGESDSAYGARLMEATGTYYGENCLEETVNWLEDLNEKLCEFYRKRLNSWELKNKNLSKNDFTHRLMLEQSKVIKKMGLTFYAHNSAGFDSHFLWKHPRLRWERIIDAAGAAIEMVLEGGLIRFRDTMRMITGSLDSNCKCYKLPEDYSKTSFPHEFASAKTLHYLGDVPEARMWPEAKINQEVIRVAQERKAKGLPEFDFPEWSMKYLKMDCISLAIIWDKFSESVWNTCNLISTDFITISNMAYQYILESTKLGEIKRFVSRNEDTFVREAIRGGRVFAQKPEFISKQYAAIQEALTAGDQEKLKAIFAQTDDYLIDLDAVGLYSSAMALFQYPTGVPKWEDPINFEEIRTKMNAGDQDDLLPLSVMECDISYPDKSIVMPILCTRPGGTTQLRYTLIDAEHVIASSIDLLEAVRYNRMVITRIHKVMSWPSKFPIFERGVRKLFDLRLKAKKDKNDALSMAIKLMMNSCYGKMIQKYHDSKLRVMDDPEAIDKLYKKSKVKRDETLANGEQCLIETDSTEKVRFPSYLGVFILAYSKRIMNRILSGINGFSDWEHTIYYTDTDSYHIHIRDANRLQEIRSDLIGESLGQLHNDISEVRDGKIIRSLFVGPKNYMDEIIGFDNKTGKIVMAYHTRCKGMPKAVVSKWRTPEFKRMLAQEGMEAVVTSFKAALKTTSKPALVKTEMIKQAGCSTWSGRKLDIENNRWLPWTDLKKMCSVTEMSKISNHFNKRCLQLFNQDSRQKRETAEKVLIQSLVVPK